MENQFLNPTHEYKRDLNILARYVDDNALYLHKRTGKPIEVCKDFIKRTINKDTGTMPLKDPTVGVLTRKTPGNRESEAIPYTEYLRDIVENDRTISPAGVVYYNKDEKPSILSEFIVVNIDKRSKSKGEKFEAEQRGDKMMYDYKENEQTSFKIFNNSLSGAQASNGTILHNSTAHPSLTSTCRIGTSFGNAITEKFLYGNRHYWCAEVARANILSIINSVDLARIQQCMDHYGIRHPTVDETMECLLYSLNLYYHNQAEEDDLRAFIATLDDVERSAFVYVQDLHHLAKYNDGVVRTMLDKLSTKVTDTLEDPDYYIGLLDSDLKAFVSLLCGKELAGTSIKSLKKEGSPHYHTVAATTKYIIETLEEYTLLIHAFWRVNTCPASVAYIRNSLRRGAITSDTDSTIFTCQAWTEWFSGQIDFSEKSGAIRDAVVYLDTQLIAHMLAMVSTGMGVRKQDLHKLSMKNEYVFPVFVLTSMAKHYFAYQSAQEGNVFKEFKTEVKGVYLKDSNCPPHVMKDFHETLNWVMDEIIANGQVSIQEVMQHVSFMEKEIEKSVYKGDSFYLKNGQVKDPAAYANPAISPYAHYRLWEAVFAPKYGNAPPPPYAASSVSVNLSNKTKIQEWCDKVVDPDIKRRMLKWMTDNNKKGMRNLLIPRSIVEQHGMPEEIIQAMNLRKLIYTTTKQYYFLLEALGMYMVNDNLTRLVSDNVEPKSRSGYTGV